MGFLDNLGNELGTKTGKAIGNKVFGKYADDVRVGYADRGEGGGSKGKIATFLDNEHESEMKQLEMQQEQQAMIQQQLNEQAAKEMDQAQQLYNEIKDIEFDVKDLQKNINVLTKLVSLMESNFVDFDDNGTGLASKVYTIASSKFDMGVAFLKSMDPNNPMIAYFEQKKESIQQSHLAKREENEKKSKKAKRKDVIVTLIIVFCLIVVPLILAMILD